MNRRSCLPSFPCWGRRKVEMMRDLRGEAQWIARCGFSVTFFFSASTILVKISRIRVHPGMSRDLICWLFSLPLNSGFCS